MSKAYLVVLGDRDAIRWVLREQRMAFPAARRAEVAALDLNDELFLYATRGAWHNSTRDRGRLIGHARVTGPVRRLETPLELADMTFHSGCDLDIDRVAPYPGGLELQPLVHRLAAFPKADAWSVYLRRPLVRLPGGDRDLLSEELRSVLAPRDEALATYSSSRDNSTVPTM